MTRTPAVMEIRSCPFCGDSMEAALGLIRHIDPTAACPIRQQSWPIETLAAWNTRTPAEPLADGEMIEIVARAIGEAERTSCGGYPSTTDSDPKWNPWLTDKHRMFARAAITTYITSSGNMYPHSNAAMLKNRFTPD